MAKKSKVSLDEYEQYLKDVIAGHATVSLVALMRVHGKSAGVQLNNWTLHIARIAGLIATSSAAIDARRVEHEQLVAAQLAGAQETPD